jgi:hypothetical protein
VKKFLLVLSLAFALVACTVKFSLGAVPLPATNLNELGANLVGMQPNACEPGAMGAVFEFEREGKQYKLLVLVRPQQSQKFLLMSLEDGDTTPVWIGSVAPDGSFQVKREFTYSEFLPVAEKTGGVCGFLGRDI